MSRLYGDGIYWEWGSDSVIGHKATSDTTSSIAAVVSSIIHNKVK
jgi:hypothetical protein